MADKGTSAEEGGGPAVSSPEAMGGGPAATPAASLSLVHRKKLGGYEFWREVLKSPRTVVAPMVDQSELAWRELSRRYGADLAFTPMINSKSFIHNPKGKRGLVFTTAPDDRPLIAQFCGNDPETLLAAAKSIEDEVDAVDINFGCPQGIARKGHYGAFLMEDWDLVSSLIRSLHEGLSVPVTCKIRVFDDREKTIQYAKMIEASGCQVLTVHGRTITQKGQLTGSADWETIKAVKEALSIPVIANGNILYAPDVDECIRQTGVDAVMSAEGNLSNPTIFDGGEHRLWKVTEEYFEIARKHDTPWSFVKSHLFKMWHACLPLHIDIRDRLGRCSSMEQGEELAAELKQRLIEAEARGLDPTHEPRVHDTKSGPRQAPPHWICQPRVRDLEKDLRVMAEARARDAESHEERKAAKKAAKLAKAAAAAAAAKEEEVANTDATDVSMDAADVHSDDVANSNPHNDAEASPSAKRARVNVDASV